MTDAAIAGRSSTTAPQRLGAAAASNPGGRRLTGDEWRQRITGPAEFLDTIFSRDQDKDAAIALFAANKWSRT